MKETDLETLSPSERPYFPHGEIYAMHGGPEDGDGTEDGDGPKNTEYDIEDSDHLQVLTLPPNYPNGDRKVPGVCAICLCAYEAGEVVAWSAEDTCQHAFHNDCLVPWLAKKNEPHCPVCRQSFCKVDYNENDTSAYESPFTFSQSFSQALARARLEASLMTQMEAGWPNVSPDNNNNSSRPSAGVNVELASGSNVGTTSQSNNDTVTVEESTDVESASPTETSPDSSGGERRGESPIPAAAEQGNERGS